MTVDGSPVEKEKAILHNRYYRTIFEGGTVTEGDIVVWVRKDSYGAGESGCDNVIQLINDATRDDFDHTNDDHDDPTHTDSIGLVRSADINGDGVDDLFAEIQLLSDKDGKYDADFGLVDDDDDVILGIETDSSAYTLCWAQGDFSTAMPTDPSQFQHLGQNMLHVFHE